MNGGDKKNSQDKLAELQQHKREFETYQKRLDNAQTLIVDGCSILPNIKKTKALRYHALQQRNNENLIG
jgi:hypothetical protein